MKIARVIINPHTGTVRHEKRMYEALKLLSDTGYETVVHFTRAKGDAEKYAKKYSARTDLMICAGGDGTLNEVASGLEELEEEKRAPLGYLPAGTCNDVASSLGIPLDPVKAVKKILSGTERKIDVGSFNGRRFLYVASFGAFTEASYSTPQAAKNALGHFAYVLEGIRSVNDIRTFRASFRIGGENYEDDWIFASVSNSKSIAGIVKLEESLVDLSDGLFEVALVRAPKNLQELLGIVRAVKNRTLKCGAIRLLHAPELTFSSGEKIPWTLDGEYDAGAEKVEIVNRRGALTLLL